MFDDRGGFQPVVVEERRENLRCGCDDQGIGVKVASPREGAVQIVPEVGYAVRGGARQRLVQRQGLVEVFLPVEY